MASIRTAVLLIAVSCTMASSSRREEPADGPNAEATAELQRTGGDAPYPASKIITGFTLDWSTHQRYAPGSDNFQLTWADDGHLYGAWGDGGGFGGTNKDGRVGLGVARIEGDRGSYRGFNVWGGHDPENPATFNGKSWGMISLDSTLYMWVVPDEPEGKDYLRVRRAREVHRPRRDVDEGRLAIRDGGESDHSHVPELRQGQ